MGWSGNSIISSSGGLACRGYRKKRRRYVSVRDVASNKLEGAKGREQIYDILLAGKRANAIGPIRYSGNIIRISMR